MITIILNNKYFSLPKQSNCFDLTKLLGYQNIRIAIEINGNIIPKSAYKTIVLHANDKIEIVKAVGGG
jgi:sulfur carrier protein